MVLDSDPVSRFWKRNLIALWLAQLVTTFGFSFTFPFFPLFFQDLGVTDVEKAAFWTGVAGWVSGIGMGLFAPFWGVVADRFGRKLNVLRSLFVGGLLLGLSGFADTPMQLLVSRFFVGATSGVVSAIMALMAAQTPRNRLPFASGMLQSALFLGIAMGPLFGGIIFDAFGMRIAFLATGGALLAAGLMVFFTVQEKFIPPSDRFGLTRPFVDLWKLSLSRAFLPLFTMVFLVLTANLLLHPALPGLVAIARDGATTATAAGIVFASMGFASSASSVFMGAVAGKMGLRNVLVIGSVCAASASLLPYFSVGYWSLAVGVSFISLFAGGLSGLVNGLIAIRTPDGQHGATFGAAQVAHAGGIALGPLVGGSAVVMFGLRSVFLIELLLFVFVALLGGFLLRGASRLNSKERSDAGSHNAIR